MTLVLKPEVVADGVSREVWYAVGVAQEVMELIGQSTLQVNSMRDGTHMAGSKHPDGNAVDFHTIHLADGERKMFNYWLDRRLNSKGFDVVAETNPIHTHVEFDPKKGEQFFVRSGTERRTNA